MKLTPSNFSLGGFAFNHLTLNEIVNLLFFCWRLVSVHSLMLWPYPIVYMVAWNYQRLCVANGHALIRWYGNQSVLSLWASLNRCMSLTSVTHCPIWDLKVQRYSGNVPMHNHMKYHKYNRWSIENYQHGFRGWTLERRASVGLVPWCAFKVGRIDKQLINE